MAQDQLTTKAAEKPRPVPLVQLPRALVGRRWWWTTLLVILGIAFLARLGFWQLDRLDQRRARNAEFVQQASATPLLLTGRLLPEEVEELRDRPAQVEGQYDYLQQIVLKEQSWQGRPGVHLVTPLRIAGSQAAVLVDRGWIPAAELAAGDLSRFNEEIEQPVAGVIQLSQTLSGGRISVVEEPQQEWYRIDIEAIQRQMPYELLPVYLLLSPDDDSEQSELPYRMWADIDLSEGPHLSYAVQWFIFATLLGVGYLRYVAVHHRQDHRAG
jgi:surfeit locus 1 family protein